MKIGINLIQYTDVQGIEVFSQNLLASLLRLRPNDEFVFFLNQKSIKIFDLKFDNVKIVVKNFKKLSRSRLIMYQQCGLLLKIKQEKIDLLYCPSTAAPIFYRKKIITIHDCAALRFKDEAGFFSRIYLKLIFLSAKYYSLGIVTVSNFSKNEIVNLLKIPIEKIKVIFEGPPALPIVKEEEAISIFNKFELLNKKYFFYIGNSRPRKNLSRLLKAWNVFSVKNPDYYLVIAGKSYSYHSHNKRVKFLGIISEKEKTILYKKSLALIFPSLYEGFGLPVLEAQSLGIPVVSSNLSSLPEIAGLGALFINPNNNESIINGMEKIIAPNFLKDNLIRNAHENLKKFSWDKSANLLLDLIDNFK